MVKKQKAEDEPDPRQVIVAGPARSSSLKAPIMLLTGHKAEVLTAKFNYDGSSLATAGGDKDILLWRTQADCENYQVLHGHKGTIQELHRAAEGDRIFTASVDKTARLWDVEARVPIKKTGEHSTFVHSVCPLQRTSVFATGSDDGTVKLWDIRTKHSTSTFSTPQNTAVTCVAFDKDGTNVISGGIDNTVRLWDRRQGKSTLQLTGHKDTITGLSVSPNGSYLLTNSMDATLAIWDIRPFCERDRLLKVMQGHTHNFEQLLLKCNWSPDGSKVSAGSSDRFVYVWEVGSRKILYKLPGHTGSVTEVPFHPKEPIIASCATDKKVYLGEIEA